MIWPGLYLLIWLLILGSALAYADDFISVRICSRDSPGARDHPLVGEKFFVRKTFIVGFVDDDGAVKDKVCTYMVLQGGRNFFVEGSTKMLREKLK